MCGEHSSVYSCVYVRVSEFALCVVNIAPCIPVCVYVRVNEFALCVVNTAPCIPVCVCTCE